MDEDSQPSSSGASDGKLDPQESSKESPKNVSKSSVDIKPLIMNTIAKKKSEKRKDEVGDACDEFGNRHPVATTSTSMPPQSISVIMKDIKSLVCQPPPDIFVSFDEAEVDLIRALIVGPKGTPYEGGFFYFILRCPNDYPISPPCVRFMTTDGGHVRFNPNLYASGRVCLSILGTWDGPQWSAVQTLSSVLISIQSLMNERPYFNEPGFQPKSRDDKVVLNYNHYLRYETMRVAVIGMLDNDKKLFMPEDLRAVMEDYFLKNYDHYVNLCNDYKSKVNGKTFKQIDPYRLSNVTTLKYDPLLANLIELQQNIVKRADDIKEKVQNSSIRYQDRSDKMTVGDFLDDLYDTTDSEGDEDMNMTAEEEGEEKDNIAGSAGDSVSQEVAIPEKTCEKSA